MTTFDDRVANCPRILSSRVTRHRKERTHPVPEEHLRTLGHKHVNRLTNELMFQV